MRAQLLYNKSDRRYMRKTLENVSNEINIELIEPCSLINPRFILSPETGAKTANYIFVPDLDRYYYINNYIYEYDRVIIECHVDVLQTYGQKIMAETVILERSGDSYDLYMDDNEVRMENYTSYETIKFEPSSSIYFSDTAEQMVMVCSGNL